MCAPCQSQDLVVEEDQGSPKERSHVLSSNIVTQLGEEKIGLSCLIELGVVGFPFI